MTPSEIEIGAMADPGFAGRPGLDQELLDAAIVFSKSCNDAGGINGQKIKVNLLDSAPTNVKARMTEACAQDFMLVGGGAVFDQDGVRTRLECLMPELVARDNDEAVKARGWNKVYDDLYSPAGAADWTPYAQKLKDSGVKALLWTGEPENLGKLMLAARDVGAQID